MREAEAVQPVDHVRLPGALINRVRLKGKVRRHAEYLTLLPSPVRYSRSLGKRQGERQFSSSALCSH